MLECHMPFFGVDIRKPWLSKLRCEEPYEKKLNEVHFSLSERTLSYGYCPSYSIVTYSVEEILTLK